VSCANKNVEKLKNNLWPIFLASELNENVNPFSTTGLDFAGPIPVKSGRRQKINKRWFLVLTCLKICAAHLEICHDQDTSCFLNALSRSWDKRRVPSQILSDNQTASVRAHKELVEWYKGIEFNRLQASTEFGYKG
jgi:hypothetical protein